MPADEPALAVAIAGWLVFAAWLAHGTADGTTELAVPDGHRCTARLEGVPVELLATAWREETLWVADGGVVGFPDYPLAAFATLTRVS